MKIHRLLLSAIVLSQLLCIAVHAESLPPHQLLPRDTLAVLTVPDWGKWKQVRADSPQYQLWTDEALKPFREHFLNKLNKEVVEPMQQQIGIELTNYTGLLQKQITVAWTKNAADMFKENARPGLVIILDAGDKAGELKSRLEELKSKWIDAGHKIKPETLQGKDFTTLLIDSGEIANALGKNGNGDSGEAKTLELTVGQSGSLLLVGTDPDDMEKILIRQTGGSLPPLAENQNFDRVFRSQFRDALAYGWLNTEPIVQAIKNQVAAKSAAQEEPSAMQPDKVFAALGIEGLQTVGLSTKDTADGNHFSIHLGVPQSKRNGLFKIMTPEAKNANPPSFVPAEVTQFQRWRKDLTQVWSTIEEIVSGINPQLNAMLQMTVAAIGKDKDPNFDFKNSVINNLGDDLIVYQLPPEETTLESLNNPPQIFLLSSPNSEQLAGSLKFLATMLPAPLNQVKEREFLGRKVHTIEFPAGPDGSTRNFSFVSSRGYVALSTADKILDQFLRSNDQLQPLNSISGLNEAAQKVGGMNTGWFSYENQQSTMRLLVETLKENGDQIYAMVNQQTGSQSMQEWIDFSKLPAFEKIQRYFGMLVSSVTSDNSGLQFNLFTPVPAELKK